MGTTRLTHHTMYGPPLHSLTSASCERDMSTKVLAAGWTTSNNFIMVAPSLEMVVLPEREESEGGNRRRK